MEEKKIYVIISQTGTLVTKIIKHFTKAPYNHSSISAKADLSEMYSFCRYFTHLPLPAGFSKEDINTKVFGHYPNIPCEIYSIDITLPQHIKYEKLIQYFHREKRNYSFNLLGFVGVLLNVPIRRKRKLVCSQFVALMLTASGIVKFPKDIFLVTPNDFRNIPNSTLVYSGNLREYTG